MDSRLDDSPILIENEYNHDNRDNYNNPGNRDNRDRELISPKQPPGD